MTEHELAALKSMLTLHEGRMLFVYNDSLGVPTIGVGRNLRDKGISPSECDLLLENDIADVLEALTHQFPWFSTALNSARQLALVDMGFMGPEKLRGFHKMIAAIQRGDFQQAAREMLDSTWAQQVGHRAVDLAAIMRDGVLK